MKSSMITLETWHKIYELSINPAYLRLITFERLIFVFSSIMNFWDERMVGINSENLHIPQSKKMLGCF